MKPLLPRKTKPRRVLGKSGPGAWVDVVGKAMTEILKERTFKTRNGLAIAIGMHPLINGNIGNTFIQRVLVLIERKKQINIPKSKGGTRITKKERDAILAFYRKQVRRSGGKWGAVLATANKFGKTQGTMSAFISRWLEKEKKQK